MLDWLYNLLGTMLAWFSSITGSYALALLLYALLFKIVFLPFSIKQQKNQIAMAKLTPKIEAIRAKYRGRTDQVTMRKQQEEIMELQRKEGYSPLSGCLPMLLQMPIIVFLYNVIRNPLSYLAKIPEGVMNVINTVLNPDGKLDQIALAGKLSNLRVTDIEKYGELTTALDGSGMTLPEIIDKLPNFNLWGLNLADTPKIASWLVLIPILAAGFQWFTMFLSRKMNGNPQAATADQQTQMSMRIMDLIFPAMTIWLTFSFSAMMGLYWIYQSIIGIIQMIILSKLMPIPKFTEEEIKAMQKEAKKAAKEQNAIIKTQPKYKSLHYIDEDDYEELPEVKSSDKKKSDQPSSSDRPEIKD
ncbi:MAG: YidC/Oxa1 family membrane protein insertase [Clostridia bacterium]|nr:YidC/Oxa1 family membrane protein insertase [Clostridia bacterium]